MTTESLTFEKVWAALMENKEQMKEQKEELELLFKEIGLKMKETDRQIGALGNRFGELAEHLVAPSINEKFNELGFHFTQQATDIRIKEPCNSNTSTEIDILLENGDIVIAVEVKAKPKETDVDEHIGRMDVLRRRANQRNDNRKFQGAIAGAIMSDSVRNYAHKTGFYVIEQTGDTVKINLPENFVPREW